MSKNKGVSTTNDSKFFAPRELGVEPSCVVLTYSVGNTLNSAIDTLQYNGTSVHYIIDKEPNNKKEQQYQYHNDLESKTFFAGKSSWKGQEKVNDFGISIMFINDAESAFTESQISKVIELLKDIKVRYPNLNLEENLVGLGEVAERHVAPGKFFPWKQLADAGFGKFIPTTKEQAEQILIRKGDKDTEVSKKVSHVQEQLKDHGYGIEVDGKCGDKTASWFEKFNTRYVPEQSPPNEWSEASQFVLDELHPNVTLAGVVDLEHVA
ncbi:N-acetylmuramoyl-L-alanine amidase [Candidatus Tisiphia endosymbiont of Parasteatoda lunata]|uniref:N-acetylmuramoyl-L-alanine amidase n=1 Tax=Candidatus Tisiphia endosymbiont of Parasteatoda lunata TaxID=3066275 RepID=UPI00313B7E99